MFKEIPNQAIQFSETPRGCKGKYDDRYKVLVQHGDHIMAQFKRGNCDGDTNYVYRNPCGNSDITVFRAEFDVDWSNTAPSTGITMPDTWTYNVYDVNDTLVLHVEKGVLLIYGINAELDNFIAQTTAAAAAAGIAVAFTNRTLTGANRGYIDFYFPLIDDQRLWAYVTTDCLLTNIQIGDCCAWRIFDELMIDNRNTWSPVTPSGFLLQMTSAQTTTLPFTFDTTKQYCINVWVYGYSGLDFDINIGGVNFTGISGTVVSSEDRRFCITPISDDITITAATAAGTLKIWRIYIHEICENVWCNEGYETWMVANGTLFKLENGTLCTMTYPNVFAGQDYSYQYKISDISGGLNLNIFGHGYTETAATGAVTKNITALNDVVELTGIVGDTATLKLYSVADLGYTNDILVWLRSADDDSSTGWNPINDAVTISQEYVNINYDTNAVSRIEEGCYQIVVKICNQYYYSSQIDYRLSHKCTRLLTAVDNNRSFGFNFDMDFELQQRVYAERLNPQYPNKHNTRLDSTGKRTIGYAEVDKQWIMRLEYGFEQNFDCLSVQSLCSTFEIDGEAFYFDDKSIEPKWDADANYNWAVAEILLYRQNQSIRGGCDDSGILAGLCDTYHPLCIASGDTVCAGETGTLSAVNIGYVDASDSYQWFFNGVLVASTALFSIVSPTRDDEGEYVCVLTNKYGCTSISSALFAVVPQITGLEVISITNTSGGLDNGEVHIQASGGTPAYDYTIDMINYNQTGIFTGLAAGTYTPYASDYNGCVFVGAPITVL